MSDLNIHDDFLDDFEWYLKDVHNLEYYTLEESNKKLGVKEAWSGERTMNLKDRWSDLVSKVESVTDKRVDRIYSYKIEGEHIVWLNDNVDLATRPHKDGYPWAGVIYLYGETGTHINGELVEFKENRFVWYRGTDYHVGQLPTKDRCVIVVFMLDKDV